MTDEFLYIGIRAEILKWRRAERWVFFFLFKSFPGVKFQLNLKVLGDLTQSFVLFCFSLIEYYQRFQDHPLPPNMVAL